jgi:hypothetical protein
MTIAIKIDDAAPNIYQFSLSLQSGKGNTAESPKNRARRESNARISVEKSTEPLPDLFSSEGADAVEAEAKQHAFFLAHANVVGVVLRGQRATVPTVAGGNR